MTSPRPIRYLPLFPFALAAIVLGHAAVGTSGQEARPSVRIVTPLDQGVLLSGNFDFVCKSEAPVELQVDGQPHPWLPIAAPARAAHLQLPPGMHRLAVDGKQIDFVVALNEMEHDGPYDWKIIRRHGMSAEDDRCGECHAIEKKDGGFVLGEFLGYEACFECHSSIDFEVDHAHILEPLEACQMCHAVHGTTEPESLLKAPMRELCEECHDPDH